MACAKLSFVSKGAATKQAALAHIIAKPYKCPNCAAWHLAYGTTKKQSGYKRTQSRGGKKGK